MTEPETQLTGKQVLELRQRYKLSRRELAIMCGWPETGVRVGNIENKESWKPGDQETLRRVFAQLAEAPTKPGRLKGETGDQRAERLMNRLAGNGQDQATAYREPEIYNPLLDPDLVDYPDVVSVTLADEPEVWEPIHDLPTLGAEDDARESDVASVSKTSDLRVLTNSEYAAWKRCKRKWWLTFYRKLIMRQQDMTGSRAIGNRVHRALAAWYVPEGVAPTDPREALERVIVEDWTTLAEQIRATTPESGVEEALATLGARFNDAVTLERAMIEGYVQWLEESGSDAGITVTASETVLMADLKVDIDGEKVPFRLAGKLDVRVHRNIDGVRLYVDHKTVGNFTSPRKTLHGDPQMLTYHLLEFLNAGDADERCDGALYNMLRKVKRTASANPPFYDRVEVHHNQREIESHHMELLGATADIIRAERRLNAGASPHVVAYKSWGDRCSWDCDFYAICPMLDDGSRAEDAISSLYEVGDPLERYDGKVYED